MLPKANIELHMNYPSPTVNSVDSARLVRAEKILYSCVNITLPIPDEVVTIIDGVSCTVCTGHCYICFTSTRLCSVHDLSDSSPVRPVMLSPREEVKRKHFLTRKPPQKEYDLAIVVTVFFYN